MNRRQVMRWSGALGALAGAGSLGAWWLLPPGRSAFLDDVDDLAARLFEALTPEERASACVPYDHPLRQYHNRGLWCGGLAVRPWSLDRSKRRLVTDLLHAGLSEHGRARVPEQHFVDLPGVHLLDLLICGDPRTPPYQVILSGPHLNLRVGGRNREGVAFGGPQVYGDQRGDSHQGLPGNVYRYQFELAQRLFERLSPGERELALLPSAPIQTRIEVRGREASLPGIPVASMAPAEREAVRELVDSILSTYPAQDVEYAWECLAANGGLEGLHLSYYEEGEEGRSHESQIFRLEGPAAVLYFRGFPHVHAFVNVAMDAEHPLSVGEVLGENPRALDAPGVRALFEAAMLEHSGADLAYYEPDAVVGRLRAGTVRTGDIYTLESWQDAVHVIEVRGARFCESFLQELESRGVEPDPRRTYAIATTGALARGAARQRIGPVERRTPHGLLRNATIDLLRERGFPGAG